MQTTNNLGLKKPGAEDVVNIEDLNSNSDALDGKFGASSGHGHTGVAGDGPKIGSGGLAAGAATDTVIGSRTVSDTTAPTGDSGTPTTLFGWLANMIKAITGGATWRTLPGMTIAAIKTILDAATNAGTASTLMKRDASGRAQVAAPSAAADIARKDTVDAVQSNLNTHAAVGSAAHGATSAPTVSTLMARDSAGRAQVVAPSVAADIANKGYVDTAVSGATIPDASLTVKGKVQLSSAVNSTSEVLAATSKAVKDAYDRGSAGVSAAAAAQSTANGAAQGRGYAPANFNDAVNPGAYHIAEVALYTNIPPGMPPYCLLTVESAGSGEFLQQIVSSTVINPGYMYARTRTETVWQGWYPIWNSLNDGSGSGLDADTLDGKQLSEIQNYKLTQDSGLSWHTENGDFNSKISTGSYTISNAPNSPNGSVAYWFLDVVRYASPENDMYVLQKATPFFGDEITYVRRCTGSVWGAWKPVGAIGTSYKSGGTLPTLSTANIISITGAGRLKTVAIQANNGTTFGFRISVDGREWINCGSVGVASGRIAHISSNLLATEGVSSPAVNSFCDIAFKNSIVVEASSNGNAAAYNYHYELY